MKWSNLNFQFILGDGYHLANQEQNICIRREKDYCEICYSTVANSDFGVSGGGGRFGDNTHGMSSGITTDKNIGYFRNQGTPDSQLNFGTFTHFIFPRKSLVINLIILYEFLPKIVLNSALKEVSNHIEPHLVQILLFVEFFFEKSAILIYQDQNNPQK